MLWIGDAWNIEDIHHGCSWDGNDSMNGRAAVCQSRHVAAKSNLRHTRDILRTGTCVAWNVASMSGASFFVAHRKCRGPSPTLSSFTKYMLHIGKTTNGWKWSDVIAILSIVLEASEWALRG